ncbi:amidohydrolase family protein [Kibdelosporangium lantanae]|uniref:Amidohydrolase family protein n=1 Tax=Kibdelosporangium lantanae TaxID=1497396 RepID=A0ABW3M809_9PSEU
MVVKFVHSDVEPFGPDDGSSIPEVPQQLLTRHGARVLNPAEAISGREALRAYTYGSAYASHQEHVKGTISIGKLADLVVLSDNPATVDPERIKDIEVLRTMVGGEFR